jgi:hypothetical protein
VVLHRHDSIVCEVPIDSDEFEAFKRDFEQLPAWAGSSPTPVKGTSGLRDTEAEINLPVIHVAGEIEIKLPDPVRPRESKAGKLVKARIKAAIGPEPSNGAPAESWLCSPIEPCDLYWISAPAPEPRPVAPVPSNPRLAAALRCAEYGWSVFPAPHGKKSSYKSAKNHGGIRWGATRDPEQLKRDWEQWPRANLGLPTDTDNGFFVIDADTIKGHSKDGLGTLAALEAELGPLPETLQAESPSGSQHRYL